MNAWTLTKAEFTATQELVSKINARAKKRGFTGRVEIAGTVRECVEVDEAGLARTHVVVDAVLSGEPPRYAGWTFLASVDTVQTEDGPAFVIRNAPASTETQIDRALLRPSYCDHCRTERPNRRYTYLVRNDDGETRQVGSTCIKDFTGWAGKPVFIAVDQVEAELNEVIKGASSAAEYAPHTVVAVAWVISQSYGWHPSSAPSSTRSQVEDYLYGTSEAAHRLREEMAPSMADANKMATTIIAALIAEMDDTSDYGANLIACLRGSSVADRHFAITVSAIAVYHRMTAIEREEVTRIETCHFGTIGEKVTITGTIARLIAIDTEYGTSMLVIIEDGPRIAKMFTAARWVFGAVAGETVTITGTVKAHDYYNDDAQTVITRPKRVAA